MWCQKLVHRLKCGRPFSQYKETIYALSSGHGKCGVAVIRVSGGKAGEAILKMTNLRELPVARMAHLKYLQDPVTGEKLDRGLILWFPGPKSFTGEDCCEFQVHGGQAVISSVLSGLGKLQYFRPAEPGEFTKRAFFNGKLDLTEVEGLADLIHAETEMQRKQALLQMDGHLSKLYSTWRQVLLKSVAHVEAYIDFGEEENIESEALIMANKELKRLRSEIKNHLADGRKGERLRDGVRTTIVGEPNAGKSSLFNALCQRPAAIVTPIPGTTRDLIELHINVNGYPLVLTDTAGLRSETSDVIEKEGISRAYHAICNSDLVLLVVDATALRDLIKQEFQKLANFLTDHLSCLNINVTDSSVIHKSQHKHNFTGMQNIIFVLNKIDLLNNDQKLHLQNITEQHNISCISCATEDGFPLFMEKLSSELKSLCGSPSEESPTLTQTRHRHHLTKCLEHLTKYSEISENVDVAAYELRKCLVELGKITGKVHNSEIIDVIFKDFCIGK